MVMLFLGFVILLWIIGIIYLVKRQERIDEQEEEDVQKFRDLIRKKFDTKGERRNGS